MLLFHIFILISECLLHCLIIIVTISLFFFDQIELAESGPVVFVSMAPVFRQHLAPSSCVINV